MTFRQIIPRNEIDDSDIKVSFSGEDIIHASLYFSHDFLSKIGWSLNSYVCVYSHRKNPRSLRIDTAGSYEKAVFKLIKTTIEEPDYSKLQFELCKCEIPMEDRKTKKVDNFLCGVNEENCYDYPYTNRIFISV